MKPDRWRRVEPILDTVLDLPEADRAAYLDRACATDPVLRADVEALLDATGDVHAFLETRAANYLSGLVEHVEGVTGDSDGAEEDGGRDGERIGRYRILRKLARGGMGTVYLAERADGAFEQNVAIKLLRKGLDTEDVLERFRAERQILASLHHPNISHLLDGGETTDGYPYLVMEYVEGEPITGYCDRARLDIHDRLKLFVTVVRAVSHAHDRGVIHRDLKPTNVLVSEDGQASLLDFGIAKLLADEDAGRTQTGQRRFTPAYASPEQRRGEPVTAASDIYQLGVLLHELLTGQRPKLAMPVPSSVSVSEEAARARDTTPTALRRTLRGSLDSVVLHALSPAPSQRYATADGLAGDVERYLAARPVRAPRRGGPAYRAGAFMARHRRRLTIGLVAACAAALLFVPQQCSSTPPTRPTTVAVLPFHVRGSEEFAYLREGLVDLLSVTLDGAGDLRTVDSRTLLNRLARNGGNPVTPGRARDLARRFGAGLYVLGGVVEAGGQIQIIATLYDATGAIQATATTGVNDEEHLFAMVDQLTRQLVAGRYDEEEGGLTHLAAVSTSSLPALKAYLRGAAEFRAGRHASAVAAFQRAVAEDTSFALAYYRLGVAASWAFRGELADRAAEQAVRNSARLPELYRRLLEARLAYRGGAADEAEDSYRAIVADYPDNMEAWSQLGEVLHHFNPLRGRSIAEARAVFERVLRNDSTRVGPLYHLAQIAALEDDRATLRSSAMRILRLAPEGDRALQVRALQAAVFGDTEAWREILRQLESADDFTLFSATYNVAMYGGRLSAATEVARLMLGPARSPGTRATGHIILAELALAQGRWKAARAELTADPSTPAWAIPHHARLFLAPLLPVARAELIGVRAELAASRTALAASRTALARQESFGDPPAGAAAWPAAHETDRFDVRLYLMGLLDARLGNYDRADAIADALAGAPDPPEASGLMDGLAQTVRASIARERGNPTDALALMERTDVDVSAEMTILTPFYAQSRARYLHAQLLDELGRKREALGWYASFAEFSLHGLIYLAPSHLRRAEIYDGMGETELAARHYGRFIELWQDCDPELRPLREAATQRLARLRP